MVIQKNEIENEEGWLINVFSKIVGGPPHTLVRMTAEVVVMVDSWTMGHCTAGTRHGLELEFLGRLLLLSGAGCNQFVFT